MYMNYILTFTVVICQYYYRSHVMYQAHQTFHNTPDIATDNLTVCLWKVKIPVIHLPYM